MIREVNRMMDNRNLDELLGSKSTPEVARDLLGMYLEYSTPEGIPQGVMIRAIEPVTGIEQMSANRGGKIGPDISNGPGKLVAALGIPQELYGKSIIDSPLHLVYEKKREPKKISALPRIGIPNKGEWTAMPLRFVVSGNPYVSLQKKNQIDEDWGWRK